MASLDSAFHGDRWVRPEQSGIDASVGDSGILLRGSVETLAAKRRAVVLAHMVSGELSVVDRLRRRPAGSTGNGELARVAASRLEDEPALKESGIALVRDGREEVYRQPGPKGYSIRINVTDGGVILSGKVASLAHNRLSEVLIWWIEDCQFVDNRLKVIPEQADSDDEINDAVELCLEKDPFVDAGQLHVQTATAIVQIEGLLRSASQRGRMLQDVWSVPGVWDVDDFTQVAS